MKKLLAVIIVLFMLLGTASPVSCFWIDKDHWVDEHIALKFNKNTVYVWQLMPEFGGKMYLGEITKKEARDYIDHWYYLHSI